MELKTKFVFSKTNNDHFFGGYLTGSLSKGEPQIMFSMDALIQSLVSEDDKASELKDAILQISTHEFCHALQEWLDKEFSEYEVEKILESINPKWGAFNDSQPVMEIDELSEGVIPITHLLEFLKDNKNLPLEEIIKVVENMNLPMNLWAKAIDQDKQDKYKKYNIKEETITRIRYSSLFNYAKNEFDIEWNASNDIFFNEEAISYKSFSEFNIEDLKNRQNLSKAHEIILSFMTFYKIQNLFIDTR